MKKTTVLMISLVFALYFPLLALAQENIPQTASDDPAAVGQTSPDMGGMGGMTDDEDMPAMGHAMAKGSCGKAGSCMKHDGAMCGPDCKDCMMKKGGMNMMNGAGKMGMHGDIDAMTWPPMQKSCKTPDYYLAHGDELDLNESQEAALEKLQSALKKEMVLKGAAVKAAEIDLSDIVTKSDFKLDDALAMLKQVEDARLALRSSVLRYSAQARDVLSPDQLKNLKGLHRPGSCMQGGGMKPGVEDDMKRMMMEKMQRERMQQ